MLLFDFRLVRKDEAGACDTPARAMVQHAGEKGKRNPKEFFRFPRQMREFFEIPQKKRTALAVGPARHCSVHVLKKNVECVPYRWKGISHEQ